MPFVAEQFIMQKIVSDADVSKSIIFRPDELFPRLWMIRGKRPLYVGSRTFEKINRGAITGLLEGHIGKKWKISSTCNWIKIKCAVGPLLMGSVVEAGLRPEGHQAPEGREDSVLDGHQVILAGSLRPHPHPPWEQLVVQLHLWAPSSWAPGTAQQGSVVVGKVQ